MMNIKDEQTDGGYRMVELKVLRIMLFVEV